MKTLISILILTLSFSAQAIPAKGHKMMIAAPSPYAVETGKKIIKMNGNVVDVAVGIALTLSVTSPYYAAFGGGGFALIKMNGKEVDVADFREIAPAATNREFYMKREKGASRNGGAAVGIPGIPAGLWEMHKKYGKLKWTKLFDDALKLSRDGFYVSGEWVKNTNKASKRFSPAGKKYFAKSTPLLPGQKLKQPQLYKALKRFKRKGLEGFYKGPIAKDIAQTVQKEKGVITEADMASYKVRWRKPLYTDYKGHKVALMPPPSSGGVVIKGALKLTEMLKIDRKEPFSVDELHYLGEILSRSFRGRSLLGDPDFHVNPMDQLLSDKHLKKMMLSINKRKSSKLQPMATPKPTKESTETTHFSVLDKNGEGVAMTITLNGNYGSAVVSERFGIALNNEMDDFTTRPGEPNMFGLVQGEGNSVQAGKRPLSSMSPTLVLKDDKVVMSLGAPGGPRIISGVFQGIYRVLQTGYDMDKAIQAPRVHHQFLPHQLYVDGWRLQPATIKGLERKKHKVKKSWIGRVAGVRMNEDGILEAAFDSRGEGAAGGY